MEPQWRPARSPFFTTECAVAAHSRPTLGLTIPPFPLPTILNYGVAMPGPQILEDEISRKLREAELSGELRSAKGYGRPLTTDEGWEQTPDELRMPFKILKNAGVIPPEIEMMKQRASLREKISACTVPGEAEQLKQKLSALELSISLRLETLRGAR